MFLRKKRCVIILFQTFLRRKESPCSVDVFQKKVCRYKNVIKPATTSQVLFKFCSSCYNRLVRLYSCHHQYLSFFSSVTKWGWTGLWTDPNGRLTKVSCRSWLECFQSSLSLLFYPSLKQREYLSFQQALFLTYRWRVNLMRWLFFSFWVREEKQREREGARAREREREREREQEKEMHTVKKVNLINSFRHSETCVLTRKAVTLTTNNTGCWDIDKLVALFLFNQHFIETSPAPLWTTDPVSSSLYPCR